MGYGFWNFPVVSYEDVKNWGTEFFTEMYLLSQGNARKHIIIKSFGLASFLNLFILVTTKTICQLSDIYMYFYFLKKFKKKNVIAINTKPTAFFQWFSNVL